MAGASTDILEWMSALADATRSRVLRLLERHELTVAELCSVLQLPQSTVSRHLKVLQSEGWAEARRQGTSSFWRMTLDELDPAAKRLWLLIRERIGAQRGAAQDDKRLEEVVALRQTRSQAFFATAAGKWDKVRDELFGRRFDVQALLGLIDEDWVVGDFGGGTGQVAEALAPFVKRVVLIDESDAMLTAARRRLGGVKNVRVARGKLEEAAVEDGELDAAVSVLVLHHLPDPAAAIGQMARATREGGKVLLVDMVRHDRIEYQQTMGHVWLGFEREEVEGWLGEAGLGKVRWVTLPSDPEAKGPALFVATATRGGRGRSNGKAGRSA